MLKSTYSNMPTPQTLESRSLKSTYPKPETPRCKNFRKGVEFRA